MSGQKEMTWRQIQKATKPPVEQIIPECLGGEKAKLALEFAAYMRDNDMELRFGGVTDTWTYKFKGKAICKVRLRANYYGYDWLLCLCVYHMDKYESEIQSKGLRDFVFDNLSHHHRCGGTCGHERRTTVFGKEAVVCWKELGIMVGDPDEAMVDDIKWILELEKKGRDESAASAKK
jgi:hypothetical protein